MTLFGSLQLTTTAEFQKNGKREFPSKVAHSWPLHEVLGLQLRTRFTYVKWPTAFSVKQTFYDSLAFLSLVGRSGAWSILAF